MKKISVSFLDVWSNWEARVSSSNPTIRTYIWSVWKKSVFTFISGISPSVSFSAFFFSYGILLMDICKILLKQANLCYSLPYSLYSLESSEDYRFALQPCVRNIVTHTRLKFCIYSKPPPPTKKTVLIFLLIQNAPFLLQKNRLLPSRSP